MKSKLPENERLLALTSYERELWGEQLCVAGMDEVGRGPLAGPVTTCCIIMPQTPLIEGVDDSKKLSEKKREQLYARLTATAIAYGVGWADEKLIDEINILNATKEAFLKAYSALGRHCDAALIDAVSGIAIPCRQIPIIHGDALSYSIAAASIIAKVERDRYMREMDKLYPQYGFAANKGYGTAQHLQALREYGPCEIHRRSFIKKYM